jgi:hypothetical protein
VLPPDPLPVVSEAAETTSTPNGPMLAAGTIERVTTVATAKATVANVFFN